MSLSLDLLHRGERLAVYAIVENGRCELMDFLEQISRQNHVVFAKWIRLLHRFADLPIHNEEKSRHLQDGLFELKSAELRVFYFYAPNTRSTIICTHGFIKKKQRDRHQILRAHQMRARFESQWRASGRQHD
ncbi:MAG: hypothetical protein CVU65_05270 [Deltaproteobacteria bacterium HGW-Deltaproteobacteria-22]|nr:MAG: hypothetical protein CVU65_05270 [Deltaproteobacteria bacterium HGW-Deltaproteobacteria-22]